MVRDVSNDSTPTSAVFEVHKQLLYSMSSYFKALLNFSEGKTDVVELDNMCPQAFRCIAQWMYTQKCPLAPAPPLPPQFRTTFETATARERRQDPQPVKTNKPEKPGVEIADFGNVDDDDNEKYLKSIDEFGNILIRAWAIADRLMMPKCKNRIMDKIRSHFNESCVELTHLWQMEALGLCSAQAVARFVKEEWIFQSFQDTIDIPEVTAAVSQLLDHSSFFSREVIATVLVELMRRANGVGGTLGTGVPPSGSMDCRYHEHSRDENCLLAKDSSGWNRYVD